MTMRVVQRVRTVAPLGIRFWDQALNAPITDQLAVTACLDSSPTSLVQAQRTPSGIYAVSGLPGLRALERPFPRDKPIAPETHRCWVHVTDAGGRFMPMLFGPRLPLPYTGLFLVNAPLVNNVPNPPGVYLFSTPGRPLQAGMAVIYASLTKVLADNTREAIPNAVVEITRGTTTWYGISDTEGRVTVMFPYPPFAANKKPSEQSWPVDVKVRCQPGKMQFPLSSLKLPDVVSLFQQNYANIWRTVAGNHSPTTTYTVTLTYGQPLTLHTDTVATLDINPVSGS